MKGGGRGLKNNNLEEYEDEDDGDEEGEYGSGRGLKNNNLEEDERR